MNSRASGWDRHGRVLFMGSALVAAGILAIAIAVTADKGRAPYLAGVACAVVGVCVLLRAVTRSWIGGLAAALSAVFAFGAAFVALDGWPGSGPDGWKHSVSMDGDHGVVGALLYTGAGARDRRTGAVRWTSPDPEHDDLVAATPTAVVINHRLGRTSDGELIGYEPASGRRLWSVRVSTYTRGVTYDGNVVVTNQGGESAPTAIGYDLRTGGISWKRMGFAASEISLGDARNRYASFERPAAGFVLAAGNREHPTSVTVVRTKDGSSVLTLKGSPLSARVVGSVFVSLDQVLTGTSVETGKRLWTASPSHAYSFFGGGQSIFLDGSPASSEPTGFRKVDVRTGASSTVRPPGGAVLDYFDRTRPQVGDGVWAVVHVDGGQGVWRIGTRHIVRVPGAIRLDIADADPSGWVAVAGTTCDVVGDKHTKVWVISPTGTLSGPFAAGSQFPSVGVAPGVVSVDDSTYPVVR